ncbi:MAG TPA: rhodanese-like domain-containing protein [Acidimicrobiia bacterium]|nr:rhodanese-like domain-containing protein [Acidimicrobiia bacterium]
MTSTATITTGARVDALLESARARLNRLSPVEAHAAAQRGALLVDTRPVVLREAHGEIPDAIVVDRNKLEWRLDPTSPWSIPQATDEDQLIIVICDEGYASSLAAASLQDLGLHNATDLIGGFQAWRAAGLPVVPSFDHYDGV